MVVYLFVAYFILEEAQAARRQGVWKRYKGLGWQHLDILNLGLLVLAGAYKMSSVSQCDPPAQRLQWYAVCRPGQTCSAGHGPDTL